MSTMNATHESHDFHLPVETTPLIHKSYPVSKRARSHSNSLGFLPNRRLKTKSRPSKPSDTAQVNTAHSDKGPSEDYSDPGSSLRTRTSSTGTTAITWPSPCDAPNSPSPSSAREPRMSFMPRVSLKLENSGSVARDHLASERTFLAYMRTSLALASSGVGKSHFLFRV